MPQQTLVHRDVARACEELGWGAVAEHDGIDLAIPDARLAIEVDGPEHFQAPQPTPF